MTPSQLRRNILQSSYDAGACHINASLSCVEMVLAIDSVAKKEDVFLFAKASGVATYYCLKHPDKATEHLKHYPLPSKEAGCIHSTGSLGHGLPVASGIAFADRENHVYCLISDGELNEGSTWEALLFIAHQKLTNLTILIDNNSTQALGKTEDICNLEPLEDKFKAFNFTVLRGNGHNQKLLEFFLSIKDTRPVVVICDTIKGQGVSFTQDYSWHYKNLTKELLEEGLKEIDEKN